MPTPHKSVATRGTDILPVFVLLMIFLVNFYNNFLHFLSNFCR
jgi:hypothetical protein